MRYFRRADLRSQCQACPEQSRRIDSGLYSSSCRRAKFFLPLSATARQRFLYATHDRVANSIWIAKTHFSFGRMHIHVHSAGIELDEKERHRILSLHERGVIAFTNRARDQRTFDRASVHKNQLLGACLPAQSRLPDQSADPDLR